MKNWYLKSASDIIGILETSVAGLGSENARMRLEQFGHNKMPETRSKTYAEIFLQQFASPVIYVLLAASVSCIDRVAVAAGRWRDRRSGSTCPRGRGT